MAKPLASTEPQSQFIVDQLTVYVYETRAAMGQAAAYDAASSLMQVLEEKGRGRALFASAPSQDELLDTLAAMPNIDWSSITAFHLDEYIGLAADAPQAFGQFLRDRLFGKVKSAQVHYLDGNAPALPAECERYGSLLSEGPIDIACIGVGENGHIAFNDPPADFDTTEKVKVVDLDDTSRHQQVHDGCFASFDEVPDHALTLTVPTITAAKRVVCVVPTTNKAAAIKAMLEAPVSPDCPASVLRRHPNAVLYLDAEAASLLSRHGS